MVVIRVSSEYEHFCLDGYFLCRLICVDRLARHRGYAVWIELQSARVRFCVTIPYAILCVLPIICGICSWYLFVCFIHCA